MERRRSQVHQWLILVVGFLLNFYDFATNSISAIGWSLTGTMNSPSSSLAVLYPQNESRETVSTQPAEKTTPSIASILSNRAHNRASHDSSSRLKLDTAKFDNSQALPSPASTFTNRTSSQTFNSASTAMTTMPPPSTFQPVQTPDPVLVSDADLLLNLHSPFQNNSPTSARAPVPAASFQSRRPSGSIHVASTPNSGQEFAPGGHVGPPPFGNYTALSGDGMNPVLLGGMTIESEDIDISTLGDEMMPWLEYLPPDMFGYFDASGGDYAADNSGV